MTATEPATPILTSISTSTGTTAGGIPVTLTGSFLSGVQAVYFGSTSAAFSVNNDNQITAIAPSESAGIVAITVVSNGGSSATSNADLFT